jgi:hypothetical protein
VLKKLAYGLDHRPGSGQKLIWMAADGDLPESQKPHDEQDGAEPS